MEMEEEVLSFSDWDTPLPDRNLKRLKKAVSTPIKSPTTTLPLPILPIEDDDEESQGDGIEGLDRTSMERDNGIGSGGLEANVFHVPEQRQKKRKKKPKSGCESQGLFLDGSNKRRAENERRVRMNDLRTETQRLLRETRDASFKPVPIVHKPVSSVLEKIRRRKLELSKKLVNVSVCSNAGSSCTFSREVTVDFDSEDVAGFTIEGNKVAMEHVEETNMHHVEGSSGAHKVEESMDTTKDNKRHSKMVLDDDSRQMSNDHVDETQDQIFYSETSASKDELLDEVPSSPMQEVLAPSILAMNLKRESTPSDELSSDEADNEKENIDPGLDGSLNLPAHLKGDPMKAFVDDEAEEEDDSDNDLGRFQDDEEDDENVDSEEVNNIIATGYKEKPIDEEMRNQLHQKWLQQQDMVGTENLLQRLKVSSKEKEMAFLDEKEDEEGEGEDDDDNAASFDDDDDDEFLNDDTSFLATRNLVRRNLKKAKEMIPHVFTDKDDVYISSDDEETENRVVKRHMTYKAEEHTTFPFPAEDDGSKGIFGLIKKMNAVPDTRKKAKITSYFHTTSIGRNRIAPSKSSFLGRGSKSSLPSFQKNGSSNVRAFVFEREDSSSRGSNAVSDPSDSIPRDSKSRKPASVKFSSSQIRSSTQNTQASPETNSGPSLHEILRCPSLKSNLFNCDNMLGQVEDIYAAFKLDQNPTRKQPSLSIRTLI